MLRSVSALILLMSPAFAGDIAFVTSQNGNAVSVVDLTTQQIIAQTFLPGAPAPVAYDAQMGRAYVIAAETGRLSVLDLHARILADLDLGEGAFGLAIAPGGGVFVTDWYGGRLLRLDADLTQIWQAETGLAPAGVAVSGDGAIVATADRDADTISMFDAETGRALHRVTTAGEHPFAVAFHDGRLWTADVMGNSVSVIDPVAGRLLGHIATGSHPYGIAFAGGRGFVTNQYSGTVTVFDPGTLVVLDTIEVGDYPEGIASLPDGSAVVIANWDSDNIVILDARQLSVTASIDMPSGPRAFGQFIGPRPEN